MFVESWSASRSLLRGTPSEPTHPRPLPGGELAVVRIVSVPLLGGVRGGFMVPMRATPGVEATHEPIHPQPLSPVRQPTFWLNRQHSGAQRASKCRDGLTRM